MQRWREQYLGLAEFLPVMADAEVDQFSTLNREELAVVESQRWPRNRLSVGLQLGLVTSGLMDGDEPPGIARSPRFIT